MWMICNTAVFEVEQGKLNCKYVTSYHRPCKCAQVWLWIG
jgi:hypothetical protein